MRYFIFLVLTFSSLKVPGQGEIIYSVTQPGLFVAYGLSTTTKPTSPPDNCLFFETNTGSIYKSSGGSWSLAPVIGAAFTTTTINKVTITAPATSATITIPDGTTLNTGAGGTLGSNAFNSTAYSPLAGSSSIVTVGTVTAGTWNGSVINHAYLGTGGGGASKFLREDNTWQTIAGGGDLLASNNLSDVANAGTSRTNLGLAIGTNVQAFDADLSTLAGLTATTDNFIVSVSSAWASRTPSQVKATLALDNVTNESKATMFTNATFTGTFDVANGAIANADLANADVANLSGTNTGDNATNTQYSGLAASKAALAGATYTGAIVAAAGTTGLVPINIPASVQQTTPASGDITRNASGVFTLTPATGENANINASMRAVVTSDFTLSAASGVQTAFPSTIDVWTLAASTAYEIEGLFIMTKGTTTNTTAIAFALGGGASVTSINLYVVGHNAVANTAATAQGTVWMTQVASTVVTATATTAGTQIYFKGTIYMNAGGTVTPQINFSANPTGTNLMKVGSYVKITRIGTNTFTSIGNVN